MSGPPKHIKDLLFVGVVGLYGYVSYVAVMNPDANLTAVVAGGLIVVLLILSGREKKAIGLLEGFFGNK